MRSSCTSFATGRGHAHHSLLAGWEFKGLAGPSWHALQVRIMGKRHANFEADWQTWTTAQGYTDLVVGSTNHRTPTESTDVGVIASLKAFAFLSRHERMRARHGEVMSEDDTGELLAAPKAAWLRQVQSGRVQDNPAVRQANWHDTRDAAEALKHDGWGDSGQFRHHDTMFMEDKTPEELDDLAAALGTSQAAVQCRSRHLCAQESRLFEAMKPGLQGAASLLGGQAREKLENGTKLMKVALRECPLELVLIPSYSTQIERMAHGIQQHPEWPEYCQSVQEISCSCNT